MTILRLTGDKSHLRDFEVFFYHTSFELFPIQFFENEIENKKCLNVDV
jgi:hypothetical protein